MFSRPNVNNDRKPERNFELALLLLHDHLCDWWREATSPVVQAHHRSMTHAALARLLMWMPVAVVLVFVLGAAAMWGFTGWRAGDLASKATANAGEGDLRMARLQVESAARLRSRDPRVLRTRALIETMLGNPSSPHLWEALPARLRLNDEEVRQRAIAMTRFGSDEQYEQTMAQLEAAGLGAMAAARRAERKVTHRDLGHAIEHGRSAVAQDDEPRHRLYLARLLAARHGPLLLDPRRTTAEDIAAMDEIAGLVDSLLDTPQRGEALTLGLNSPRLSADRRVAWAEEAFKNPTPENPALLPAAYTLLKFSGTTLQELRRQLATTYLDASLPQQAAFAKFLLASGSPEGALEVISPGEAAQDAAAFEVRAQSLAATGQWKELLAMTEGAANVPDSLRLVNRAEAAKQLGRVGASTDSLRQAIRSALREGTLVHVLTRADMMGNSALADTELVALCSDAGHADIAFLHARERFGRSGRHSLLRAAYERAKSAARFGSAVSDYRRYTDLLAGKSVNPSLTAAAVAENPSNRDLRMTHAFALLQAGRGVDAWSVFDDFTVFFDELPPGQQAIMCAIVAAKGDPALAQEVARRIDITLLCDEEYLLILPLRLSSGDA